MLLCGLTAGSIAADYTDLHDCFGLALTAVNGAVIRSMDCVAKAIRDQEKIVLHFDVPVFNKQRQRGLPLLVELSTAASLSRRDPDKQRGEGMSAGKRK